MERRGTGCRSRFARLLGFRGRLVAERFVDARRLRVFLRRQTQKPIGDCGPGTCLRGCALLPCEGTALRRGKSRKIILPPFSVVKKLSNTCPTFCYHQQGLRSGRGWFKALQPTPT